MFSGISLSQGGGGREMQALIESIKRNFPKQTTWNHTDEDSAVYPIGNGKYIVFTTDSFTVTPLFFPGGNIGDISFCGTCNDLLMMGAKPLGLSYSLILEEGFPVTELEKINKCIGTLSEKTGIPIVTGDTKVLEKGKIDRLVINTSGVGIADKDSLLTKPINEGDKIIISGGIGEHAVALLSKRFEYETDIITDSKPLVDEINEISSLIKAAKDPTRGGIAAVLNEFSSKEGLGMIIDEESIPVKNQVSTVCEMLGLDAYELACEGRLICISSAQNSEEVLKRLKKFNSEASIIGQITKEKNVILKTSLGERVLRQPSGRLVPRIC